jgi:hypothetical protein
MSSYITHQHSAASKVTELIERYTALSASLKRECNINATDAAHDSVLARSAVYSEEEQVNTSLTENSSKSTSTSSWNPSLSAPIEPANDTAGAEPLVFGRCPSLDSFRRLSNKRTAGKQEKIELSRAVDLLEERVIGYKSPSAELFDIFYLDGMPDEYYSILYAMYMIRHPEHLPEDPEDDARRELRQNDEYSDPSKCGGERYHIKTRQKEVFGLWSWPEDDTNVVRSWAKAVGPRNEQVVQNVKLPSCIAGFPKSESRREEQLRKTTTQASNTKISRRHRFRRSAGKIGKKIRGPVDALQHRIAGLRTRDRQRMRCYGQFITEPVFD